MIGIKKTLADLKREAKAGKLSGEKVLRCGMPNVPDKLKGIRRIVSSNSVGITFLNAEGKKIGATAHKCSFNRVHRLRVDSVCSGCKTL